MVAITLTRRAILATLAGAPALTAAFWDQKQYDDWSDEEVLRLLTNSPWARSKTIRLKINKSQSVDRWEGIDVPGTQPSNQGAPPGYGVGSPVGGIGAPRPKLPGEAAITVLWASALPIKKAVALSKLGPQETLSEETRRDIDRSSADYVVGVYGIPAIVAHGGAQLIQTDIYRTARLRTAKGRVSVPASVYASIEGARLVITMRFSRTEPITLEDKWAECSGSSDLFEFRTRFNLRQMVTRDGLKL